MMNTRFCILCMAALPLLPATVRAADTPAVAAVRRFLAYRATGQSAQAFRLLSIQQMDLTEKEYAADSPALLNTWPKSAPRQFGAGRLFFDTRNTQHYTFAVIGLDPANPAIVLVRAVPPPSAKGVSAVTVRVLTVLDPFHASRLDLFGSMQINAPPLSPQAARKHAQDLKFMQDLGRMESQNQLKYMAVAIEKYLDHSGGKLPDAGRWVEEIMPYLPDKTYFRDPTAPQDQLYGYAYNTTLSGQPLAALASPDDIVLIFESVKNQKDAADTGESVPQPGRHEGGTNYLFAGGRVDWLPDSVKPSYRLDAKPAPLDKHS